MFLCHKAIEIRVSYNCILKGETMKISVTHGAKSIASFPSQRPAWTGTTHRKCRIAFLRGCAFAWIPAWMLRPSIFRLLEKRLHGLRKNMVLSYGIRLGPSRCVLLIPSQTCCAARKIPILNCSIISLRGPFYRACHGKNCIFCQSIMASHYLEAVRLLHLSKGQLDSLRALA